MTTRRLIFHFYVYNEWEKNPVYYIHKYFLKKYCSVFTDAVFVISLDDVNDWQLINSAQRFIIDCGFKNLKFIVEENTRLYEVETFDNHILKCMQKLDGLTFFAHVKGISDYNNKKMNKEAVLLWISSLYYLGLEFYKEAEWAAYTAKSCFFGGPLCLYKDDSKLYLPKNRFMYSGTFYWINGKEVYERFNGEYPEIRNRYYAEHFPGNLCKIYDYEAYSHNYMMVNVSKVNGDIFSSEKIAMVYLTSVLKEEGEIERFLEECNNLKKYLIDNGITY